MRKKPGITTVRLNEGRKGHRRGPEEYEKDHMGCVFLYVKLSVVKTFTTRMELFLNIINLFDLSGYDMCFNTLIKKWTRWMC